MLVGQVLGEGSCIYFENAGRLCNLAWHFVFKVEETTEKLRSFRCYAPLCSWWE